MTFSFQFKFLFQCFCCFLIIVDDFPFNTDHNKWQWDLLFLAIGTTKVLYFQYKPVSLFVYLGYFGGYAIAASNPKQLFFYFLKPRCVSNVLQKLYICVLHQL